MSDAALTADDVDIMLGQHALPTQDRFLACNAAAKAYIGPFGSGKTKVLAWQAMILSHYFAPNNGLIARLTYPDLRDTTRQQFMAYVPAKLVASASLPEKGDGYVEWRFGGRTLFRNLDDPAKFGSLFLGYAGIDEMAEIDENVFNALEARVGRLWKVKALADGKWPYSPIYGVGNPGGHDWIYNRFFNPKRKDEYRDRYKGFQPEPRENEANLPPGYYERLAIGKPEWWIRRFLRGDMRSLEGLVLPTFDFDLNVVHPFPIPPPWHRVRGVDHGQRNPTAMQWWTVDHDGNLICYRDYEIAGPTVREHAKAWKFLTGKERIDYTVADPSMFNKTQSRGDKWHSIADEYEECGILLTRGDNAMEASLARVNLLLWADPSHRFPEWHPRAGQPGAPRMYFFETCEKSYQAVSAWKFKNHRGVGMGLWEQPEDVNDHLPDCTRYVAVSFPEPTLRAEPQREPTVTEWQVKRKVAIGRELRRAASEPREVRDDYV